MCGKDAARNSYRTGDRGSLTTYFSERRQVGQNPRRCLRPERYSSRETNQVPWPQGLVPFQTINITKMWILCGDVDLVRRCGSWAEM